MSVQPAAVHPAPHFSVQLDGRPADAKDLHPIAFAGFAHFTALQVRAGRAKGMDLHLHRLKAASLALFGQALVDEEILSHLRAALAEGPGDVSLTATVFARSGEFAAPDPGAGLSVLVRTGPPSLGPAGPLALAAFSHERALPHVKQVGEVMKTVCLHRALAAGFDDAAFVDAEGRLSEATIWNLAFWDGETVVWPEAAILDGVTRQIVARQLQRLGFSQRNAPVALRDLSGLSGAAVMNSWTPGVAVSRIQSAPLHDSQRLVALLHQAYEAEPSLPL
jgi:branched-subunit amino acid aminotransferase/4-amino-4-deoxychorismate lyase